jgi:hypothetical protein
MPVDLEHLLVAVLTPEVALGVLDDLCHERRLTRPCGSRIQDCILAQMDAHGRLSRIWGAYKRYGIPHIVMPHSVTL